jgi:hypothetical protein
MIRTMHRKLLVGIFITVLGLIAGFGLAITHGTAAAQTVSYRSYYYRHHHPSPSPTPTSPSPTPTTPSPTPTTPSPSPSSSSPPPPPPPVTPNGVPGNWSLKFDDEFSGTSLDGTQWNAFNGQGTYNNVTMTPGNLSESGGVLGVTLSSSTGGALACSTNVAGDCQSTPAAGWALPVGGYAEARIDFPGSGSVIDNWPAFWACQMVAGRCHNAAGEIDIAEGLGTLTVNYHSPTANTGYGTVPGTWAGGFHTYGVYRSAANTDLIYYDGMLVDTVKTSDNGGPEDLILEAGEASGRTQVTPATMQVDYVRGWTGSPS